MTSPNQYALSQLQILEAESIHIIREVVAQMERPALLFSGGKDSIVLLHLAMKAFHPAPIPFPIVHVDTGHNFPEVLEFRDSIVEKHGIRLVVKVTRAARGGVDAAGFVLRDAAMATRCPLFTFFEGGEGMYGCG